MTMIFQSYGKPGTNKLYVFIKDVSIEENEVQNIYNVSNRIDFIS